MIIIHEAHRRLAEVTHMATDRQSNLIIGRAELQLIIPLLRQNLELVRQLDELKNLSMVAYETGDMGWVQDVCRQIDELEARCL